MLSEECTGVERVARLMIGRVDPIGIFEVVDVLHRYGDG
jgi:hypothetical protein